MNTPSYPPPERAPRGVIAFALLFLLLLSAAAPAQEEKEADTPGQVSSTTQELGKLSRAELCKTPEGRQYIFNNYDQIMLRDLKSQWEGLKANNQTTARTFEDYVTGEIANQCENPDAGYVWSPTPPPRPAGTCDNPRFEAPLYDVRATVRMAQTLAEYYDTSTDPQAGSTPDERRRRRNDAIVMLLKVQESDLYHAYQTVGCVITDTAECSSHTGEVEICDKTFLNAPPDQEFVPGSLKGLRHVKRGPALQSPTVAWYAVGKTGHGSNFGSMRAHTRFSLKGAERRAAADVDVIRREFIARGFPVDKAPAPVVVTRPHVPSPTPAPTPMPAPANIIVKNAPRPGNKHYYDVFITNTGKSPGFVSYRIYYLDGFFTVPRKKLCREEINLLVNPGQTITDRGCHDWHALSWDFERL
jgi:hypothetical protein